jgi:hypothetical protein
MKRFFITGLALVTLLLGAVSVYAATHAGRQRLSFTSTATLTRTSIPQWAKLDCLTVKYSATTNVTLYVSTVRHGSTNLLYKVEVLAADSAAIFPDAVWMDKADLLLLSNSIPVQATVEADFSAN